jgi:hypothetical protein
VGAWVLRSLSVAFWGDGGVSEIFLIEVFFLINGSVERLLVTFTPTPEAFVSLLQQSC